MSTIESQRTDRKRQRIMIVTVDESTIDRIEKSNDTSFLEQIVVPSDSNSIEGSIQHKKGQVLHKKNKLNDTSLVCVICGASASGYNFGAIACESCKAFFRRNARKTPTAFHCDGKGDCRITAETRRYCSACRLTRCFNSGMQSDRLLTAEQRLEKRRQIDELRKLPANSNLERDEDLQLSLSPLSNDLLTSIDTHILSTDFTNFLPLPLQQTLLNSDDLQRIETLSYCYRKRIEIAARDGLPWDTSMHSKTFIEVLNSYSIALMRLLSFFKQIPEFNQLNVDDRVTLIKYNIPTVLGIKRALAYNPETHEIIESEFDVPPNIEFYPVLHGYSIYEQSKKVFLSFLRLVKYDRKIIEIALIVLIFTQGFSVTNSHDERVLIDTRSVHRAHHYYTELLWKYMETMYGYKKAVSLFSELINHIISLQTLQEETQNNILRVLSPDDRNKLLPIIKSVLSIS